MHIPHARRWALLLATISLSATAVPVTYNVNFQAANFPVSTESLIGTITTDGTFGRLTQSNIVHWDLSFTGFGQVFRFSDTLPNQGVHCGNYVSDFFPFGYSLDCGVTAFGSMIYDTTTVPEQEMFFYFSPFSSNLWGVRFNRTEGAHIQFFSGAPVDGYTFFRGTPYTIGEIRRIAEPSTLALIGLALAGLSLGHKQRRSGWASLS